MHVSLKRNFQVMNGAEWLELLPASRNAAPELHAKSTRAGSLRDPNRRETAAIGKDIKRAGSIFLL